jgi:hypothetical protein
MHQAVHEKDAQLVNERLPPLLHLPSLRLRGTRHTRRLLLSGLGDLVTRLLGCVRCSRLRFLRLGSCEAPCLAHLILHSSNSEPTELGGYHIPMNSLFNMFSGFARSPTPPPKPQILSRLRDLVKSFKP